MSIIIRKKMDLYNKSTENGNYELFKKLCDYLEIPFFDEYTKEYTFLKVMRRGQERCTVYGCSYISDIQDGYVRRDIIENSLRFHGIEV